MKFTPCATGTHSSEKPTLPPSAPEPTPPTSSTSSNGVETYGTPLPAAPPLPVPTPQATPKPTSTSYIEEQDDPSIKLENGMKCKRKSCGKTYEVGMERGEEECCYHPGAPFFREGSKGYSCCKRRVLEFDEFREFPPFLSLSSLVE